MNETISYYRKLSIVGAAVFVILVVIQLFWLKKALALNRAEHQLVLKEIVADIALKVNGLDHSAFHGKEINFEKVGLQAIDEVVEQVFQLHDIQGEYGFAIFEDTVGGKYLSNVSDLQEELKSTAARACISCIISFSVSKDSPKEEGENDEAYFSRLREDEVFQYYSPVNMLQASSGETIYISIHHENNLWQTLGSLWYLFTGSVLFSLVLMLLFRYLINSLSNYKQMTLVKNDFFNNMTHEFKTPISSIRLAARMLKAAPTGVNNERYLDIVEKESVALENQIDRLLTLSLIDNKELVLNNTEVTFVSIFEKVKKRMLPLVAEKKATLIFTIHNEQESVNGDLVHLTNCFCNLIENSLKYGGENVVINVALVKEGEARYISFTDNGPGIPENQKTEIFTRFFRGQNGNQYKHKGFGIGLSYVHNIINLHNGSIVLDVNYKAGAKFLIYL